MAWYYSPSWVQVIIQVICDGESVNTSRIVKSSKTKNVSVKLSSSSCLFWVNALHKDIVRRIFYLFFYSILFLQSAAWMCSCLFVYVCLWILFGIFFQRFLVPCIFFPLLVILPWFASLFSATVCQTTTILCQYSLNLSSEWNICQRHSTTFCQLPCATTFCARCPSTVAMFFSILVSFL